MYKVALIPGDGIGKEVIPEAVRVLKQTNLNFDFSFAEIGYDVWKKTGQSVTEDTLEEIKKNQAILFGATTTPNGIKNYKSAILTLRKSLDLYANIRPIKSYQIKGIRNDIDLIIVRENTEGLYSEIEFGDNNSVYTIRVITKTASERIAKVAFNIANTRRKKVTIVTKTNILRKSCGLFRDTCLNIQKEYPDIETNEMYIDTTALNIIIKPEYFDVILTTNLFGDILSDEAAGLIGGLGVTPSANIGEKYALFEPVHGSAPDIAGKGIANPMAAILSAVMMLQYFQEKKYADKIENAINIVLKEAKYLTPDLGGNNTTKDFTDAVISSLDF
ncbi:isocitrate/isopropylmalate dehydrogenase family protein [Candidatus Bathyarchaeota archaeon]|nr:isocitrate/isopropylmalate dehydrogenase family protein [Candidatus Bathyarchaeota archaeon]